MYDTSKQGYNIGQNPYATSDPSGVFWKGTDGNVWVRGNQGTNSAGKWDANTNDYWMSQGYGYISDPNPQAPVLGDPTSTARLANGGGSQYDTGLYDQAINNLQSTQGTLDQQKDIGLQNINGDYQNNLQRLLNARNQTEKTYNTNKATNEQDNQKARSNIDFETGQRANALQRLLGSKGAGSSSAARFTAPYAAALEGTQQLNQVGDSYAKNQGALDTSWNSYLGNYDQSQKDLEAQKMNAQRSLESDVVGKRQTLLQQLAQLQTQRAQAAGGNPIAASQATFDQANALNPQIAQLGAQYFGRVNVADPTYQAPDLAKYNYDQRSQLNVSNNQQQQVSPYLSILLGADKKKQQQQPLA